MELLPFTLLGLLGADNFMPRAFLTEELRSKLFTPSVATGNFFPNGLCHLRINSSRGDNFLILLGCQLFVTSATVLLLPSELS